MTVSSVVSTAERSWTGTETLFATGYKALEPTHCIVKTATETLRLGTHYSAELAGGTSELIIRPLGAMPAAPQTLTIDRATPAVQSVDLLNSNSGDAETQELLFDRMIMVIQENLRDAQRARDAANITSDAVTNLLALLDNIVKTGPVQSVNGQTGIVTVGNDALIADQSVTAAKLADGALETKLGFYPSAHVATISALKALNPSKITCAFVRDAGRAGMFVWKNGDFAAAIALDTLEGIYVKANSVASNLGAWVRQYEWNVDSSWFGAQGDNLAWDDAPLDASLAMAILEGVGLGYSGAKGCNFRRQTPHLIDMAGVSQTFGMKIEGLGNQRTIINVRAVATSPQAKIFSSGGFVGATITALSGNGTTVTASWANSITPPVGGTLEISGCSTAGYNGNWEILTAGPGTATFACTATGTPVTKGTASQRVIQGNTQFVNWGIAGNTTGTVLEIGSHDWSDQLNRNYYDLTVTNDTNASGCRAVEINQNYHCFGIINAVLGGTITGGSAAICLRAPSFCGMSLGGGNAYYGVYATEGWIYGNNFTALDSEIVTIGFNNDSPNFINNGIDGGTLGYTSYGAISVAGSKNRFKNVHRNSGAPFFHPDPAFQVGIQLDDGEYIGFNGINSFGNEYKTGSAVNTTITSGSTLPAPADGITRTYIWTTAGTAAALTITLPASPRQGKVVEFFFQNAVTALTISSALQPVGWVNPTAIAAKTLLKFTYDSGYWWQC